MINACSGFLMSQFGTAGLLGIIISKAILCVLKIYKGAAITIIKL